MSLSNSHDAEDARSGRHSIEDEREPKHPQGKGASLIDMLPYSPSLLDADSLRERGSSSIRAATMLGLQQTHGNRAVQRFVPRQVSSEGVRVQRFWDSMMDMVMPTGEYQPPAAGFGMFGGGEGSGPFYNPTPSIPSMPQMPSSGPFYNPTPSISMPGINAPGELPVGQPFTGGPGFEEYFKSILARLCTILSRAQFQAHAQAREFFNTYQISR